MFLIQTDVAQLKRTLFYVYRYTLYGNVAKKKKTKKKIEKLELIILSKRQ